MNLKIELTDLPEFENNLEVIITLRKDGNSGGDVKVSSTTSSFNDVIKTEIKQEKEKTETKKKEKKSKISVDGEGIEAKVSSSTKTSKPEEPLSNTSSSNSTPAKSKFSGNMMNLDF